MNTPPEDIGARRPVDRTAAIVVSRGYHFDSKKIPGCVLSDTPPAPTQRPPTAADLGARRFGRFTVIGYVGRVRKSGKTDFYWSVRCTCGLYSIRRHRAILNQANQCDACERCRHLAYLQRAERYRREVRE